MSEPKTQTVARIMLVEREGADPQFGIQLNAVPMIEAYQNDPAIWAQVVGALIQTVANTYSDVLRHPETDEALPQQAIRERILEVLQPAVQQYAGQGPQDTLHGGPLE